jgi:acetoacetate decarboxylase
MPVLYLDQAMPIIMGREIYGYPKVDAAFDWIEKDGSIHATVSRQDTTLIDIKLRLGPPLEQIPEIASGPNLNLKLIPSVQKDAPPAVHQLTATVLQDSRTTLMRPAEAELAFGSTDYDPLAEIPVVAIVGAAYYEQSFVLGHGKVVHDYLSEEPTREP